MKHTQNAVTNIPIRFVLAAAPSMSIYHFITNSHLFRPLHTIKIGVAEQLPQSCKTAFSSHPWAITTQNRYIGYHPDLKSPGCKCQLLFLTDEPVCGLQSPEIAFTSGQKRLGGETVRENKARQSFL